MTATRFEHTHPRTRIVVGPGEARNVGSMLAELGLSRPLIVCGGTVSRGPQLAAVADGLDGRIAGVFNEIGRHGELTTLGTGASLAREGGADSIVSIGGGAAIDSAKFIAVLLAAEGPLQAYQVPHAADGMVAERRLLPASTLPHVAVPTTTGSSSEIMPWTGVRDPEQGIKMLFNDPALVPQIAVLDPELATRTGPELTATSGATAVARGVEALYSLDRQPLADGYALQALRLLADALPRSIEDGSDLDAREDALVGSLLSGIAAQNAMVSVTHAFGHTVGGRYALQHGIAHAILLPHVARRCLPTIGEQQRALLAALGGGPAATADAAGEESVRLLEELIARLPIPARLRDAGVPEGDVPVLAALVQSEPMLRTSPIQLSEAELRKLVEEAW
jgi:alcohol dehydrogenase class IV